LERRVIDEAEISASPDWPAGETALLSLAVAKVPTVLTVKMYEMARFESARVACALLSPCRMSFLMATFLARLVSWAVTLGAVIVALRPIVVTVGAGSPSSPGETLIGVGVGVGEGVGFVHSILNSLQISARPLSAA
jgi:hypothetical protein